MGVLLHAAGQFPGAVAAGAVGVVLILGQGAGQSVGVHRLLFLPEAGVGVLVLLDLNLAADPFPVLIVAFLGMGVEKDFLLVADQHRLGHRVGGKFAGEDLLLLVAGVGVFAFWTNRPKETIKRFC